MRKSSAVNLNHHIALVKQSSGLKVEVTTDMTPFPSQGVFVGGEMDILIPK